MNEHYVLLTNPTISNDIIKFNFPFNNMERIPNYILELISGSIKTTGTHDGVDLRMLNTVFNYSSNDNKGVSLGIFIEGKNHVLDYTQSSNARYTVNGNMNTIEFNAVDLGNSAISNVSNVKLLFKLSFPKPNELQMDYRSRVPLPSTL
tara:strand:+ start:274 stop:720 length:447 start_codon:yes stop_codon:yes gene_type:complete